MNRADTHRPAIAAMYASVHRLRVAVATVGKKRTEHETFGQWEYEMSLGMILLIVVILMLVGAIPSWPHSRSWGYGPSGGLGLVLLIVIVLVVLGKV
jgi:hypothetical protein